MIANELYNIIKQKKSFLCVGLDSDISRLPRHLLSETAPLFTFNKAIIDATAEYAVAFKPNVAFYEALGTEGWRQLELTVTYIRLHYPDLFIIADAKRGDIGNTSRLYAEAFFKNMDVDAVTLSPYMGRDTAHPFLDYPGKWAILLALTSNESAVDFEMLETENGKPVYEVVLEKSKTWGTIDNTMYVVGATQVHKLAEIRRLVPDHFLLVPGVGAQGGSLADVAKYGMNSHCGLLVNSSREIIFADSSADFAIAAAAKAKTIQQEMEFLLQQC